MPADSSRAVFLSYASEDTEAARRICEALRATGVAVWFDVEGGLETGDEWDAKIRGQIKQCVLFLPVISANTQAREEGYFRIEWDLAVERARGIASGVPFILPIVIDGTCEPDALVPDRFRSVQWTRARNGELTPDARAKFARLWSHRAGLAKHRAATEPAATAATSAPVTPESVAPKSRKAGVLALGGALLLAAAVFWYARREEVRSEVPRPLAAAVGSSPDSGARQLALQAQALFDALDSTREDFRLAEELLAKAKTTDPTNAEVCAIEAQLHQRYLQRGWDTSDTRRESARAATQRAIRLDPGSFETRFAQACLLGQTGREGEERERQLRALHLERPKNPRVLRALATVVDRLGRFEEAAVLYRQSASLPGGDPLALYNLSQAYWFAGRARDAEATMAAALAQKEFTGALLMGVWYKAALQGDITEARRLLERIAPAQMQEDRAAFFAYFTEMLGRAPDAAIRRLQAVPRDWMNDSWYRGPKGILLGEAHALAGRKEAAALEWRAALALVEQRRAERPRDAALLRAQILLLARLERLEEAGRQFALFLEINRVDPERAPYLPSAAIDCLIALGRRTDALRELARYVRTAPNWAATYPSATLRRDPFYDSLRSEPGFARLVAEIEERERAVAGAAPTGTAAAVNAPPGVRADVKSVAILAFANLSDDKANEYFSDGVSEELINVLGRVPGLKVSARTSAFHFKGKDTPVSEIARQLGVAYVVEGSVRRSAEQVRVTAQLIKAADGFQVWGDTFTRNLRDVFAVQDEIAGLIAKNLQLNLGASARATRTVHPDAHRLVLEGRHHWLQRTDAAFARAEELYGKALVLDPNFADAHAGIADVFVVRGWYHSLSGEQVTVADFARARTEANNALQLDPTMAEPHASLGAVNYSEGRFPEAELAFQEALRLNPNHAVALHWRSHLLMSQGRLDEALASIERSVELDPLSSVTLVIYSAWLDYAGDHAKAVAISDRALALRNDAFVPLYGIRAVALWNIGRHEEAIAAARIATRDPKQQPRWWVDGGIIQILREAGLEAEATAHAERMVKELSPGSTARASVLAGIGNVEQALRELGLSEGMPIRAGRTLTFYSTAWREIRQDPRYAGQIAKLGLSEPYRRARETVARLEAGRR